MSFDGGFGVLFKIGDGDKASVPTYTQIAQVKKWNGIEIGAILSEVTHHSSPGGFRQKVPSGLFEVSDIELELAFDITDPTHANASGGLIHAQLNKTKLAYQIVLPDASTTTWTFDAYVQKLKLDSQQEEHVMGNVTLVITGQPELS